MGFLQNKKILVTGLLSNRSIAYGIARACHREGAALAFTYQNDRFKDRVAGMASEFDSDVTFQCDVSSDEEIERLFSGLASRWDGLDGLVHAIAFAPREAIDGEFLWGRGSLDDKGALIAILEACIEGDAAAALAACAQAGGTGTDAKRLSEHLVQAFRDLVVLRVAPEEPQLVEASDEDVAELRALAERTDATRLRRMFRALVKEQEDLAWAPQPFAVLGMALVRLAKIGRAHV